MGAYVGDRELVGVMHGVIPTNELRADIIGGSPSIPLWQRDQMPPPTWAHKDNFGDWDNGEISSTGADAVALMDFHESTGGISVTLDDPVNSRTNNMRVVVRALNSNTGIQIRRNSSFGRATIFVIVGGSQLSEYTSANFGVTAKMRVEVTTPEGGGTLVKVFDANGAEKISHLVDTTFFDNATKFGFACPTFGTGEGAPTWKDFKWYSFGTEIKGGWKAWGESTWEIHHEKESPYERWVTRSADGKSALEGVVVKETGNSNGLIRVKLDPEEHTRVVFRAANKDNYLFIRRMNSFSGRWYLGQRIDGVETGLFQMPGSHEDDTVMELYFWDNKVRFKTGGDFAKVVDYGDAKTVVLPSSTDPLKNNTKHGMGDGKSRPISDPSAPIWKAWAYYPVFHAGSAGSALASIPSADWVGRQIDVFQLALPPVYSDQAIAIMWGVNDAISTSAKHFTDVLEATISRMLAINIIDSRFLPRTGSWVEESGTKQNSGDGWIESSSVGDSVAIELPYDNPGGVLSIAFICKGGRAEIKMDGESVKTTSPMSGEWGFEPIICERITVPAGEVNLEVKVHSGTVAIDSLWLEQTSPRIAVGNVAKFLQGADFTPDFVTPNTVTKTGANWETDQHAGATIRIYEGPGSIQDRPVVANTSDTITIGTAWSTHPVPGQSRVHVNQVGSPWGNITDKKIEDMNAELERLESSFSNVTIVDVDKVLSRKPHLFSSDKIHLSVEGYEKVAEAFVDAFGGPGPWDFLWVFGHSLSTGVGAGVDGFGYQLIKRLELDDSVVDRFQREGKKATEYTWEDVVE